MARILQEEINAFEGLFNAMDGLEISARLSPEACELTTRVLPAPEGVLAPLAEKQKAADWTVARALPPNTMLAGAWRLEPAAAERVNNAFALAIARVASGPEPEEEEVDKYRKLARQFTSMGEVASAGTISGGRMESAAAFGAEMSSVRKIYRDMLPVMDEAFRPMLEAMGMGIRYEYVADARRREGAPVDRITTTYEFSGELGEQQAAMIGAMFGGPALIMELAGAPWGSVMVMGAEPAPLLDKVFDRIAADKDFRGRGWPAASRELREALAGAPERTWLAGEVQLGAYFAFVFELMRKAQPMMSTRESRDMAAMFPDATDLAENDPPFVFWAASEGGEIVAYSRTPVAAVANLVRYFTQMAEGIQGGEIKVFPMQAPGGR